MNAFQHAVLAINTLVAIAFGVDCLVVDSPKVTPRTKARIGVLLAVLFLLYLVALLLYAVLRAALNRNALDLAPLAFVIVPFAIGRRVSYRTLRLYAVLQMLALLLSAATLCVI